MAEFNCTFSKSVSNCSTMTITDTSNYGYDNNTDHFEIASFVTRTFTMKDLFGNVLATTTVNQPTLSAVFDISNLLSLSPLYVEVSMILHRIGGGDYSILKPYTIPCLIP